MQEALIAVLICISLIVMLSIFSCASWPSVCIYRESRKNSTGEPICKAKIDIDKENKSMDTKRGREGAII